MASVVEQIEGIWVAHTKLIDGIKDTLSYEPDTVDRKGMPLLTMFFLLPSSEPTATGPEEDLDYRWEVSLYVSMTSFKDAQFQMRDLSQLVVKNFRDHRDDYDLFAGTPPADIFARQLRRREPPTPGPDDSYLRGTWELQITSGEQ